MARSPERLKAAIASGLLSFPVTHFADDGAFAPGPYQEHIDYLISHRPAALFAAGGTGEFFSLQLDEYEKVIAAAVELAGGRLPVLAGVGYGTALAIEFARRAENAGADGVLLLPPYLIQAEQEGLYRHIAAICRARRRRRRRLPSGQLPVRARHPAKAGGSVPEPDRFQGWPWQCRAVDVPSREPWRPPGLCWRDAHGGGLRSRQSGDRRLDLFIRDFQFPSRIRATLLRGAPLKRQRVHSRGDAQFLHSVSRAQEPASRLCGEHRQGWPASRRQASRSCSPTSAGSHPGARSGAGWTCSARHDRDGGLSADQNPGVRGGMKR